MDFQKLLNLAEKVQQVNTKTKEKTKLYSTSVGAAKKEVKDKNKVAANVQAFLKRKEDEEKLKEEEAKKAKEELLHKRDEAHHNQKANAMASRTKDNMKVFSEEQLEEMRKELELKKAKVKEALLSGGRKKSLKELAKEESASKKPKEKDDSLQAERYKPSFQPKETVSAVRTPEEEAERKRQRRKERKRKEREKREAMEAKRKQRALERAQMTPIKSPPNTSRSPIQGTRVKENTHHKHKHKHSHKHKKHKSDKREERPEYKPIEQKPAKKPKLKLPNRNPSNKAPLSFEDLLKLAMQKPELAAANKNPDKTEKKLPPIKKKPERPMTQEEKEREVRKNSEEYKRFLKFGGKRPDFGKYESRHDISDSDSEDSQARDEKPTVRPSISAPNLNTAGSEAASKNKLQPSGLSSKSLHSPGNNLTKPLVNKPHVPSKDLVSRPSSSSSQSSMLDKRKGDDQNHSVKTKPTAPKEIEKTKVKEEPQMSTWDRLYSSVKKNNPPKEKKKRVVESDSEYDSEYDEDLDDFIDDGDAEEDYSKHIKDIFGYDKSRYKYVDDDDISDMEANYNQIEAEEKRSSKLGLKEDIEDIRREEEHKKRKMMMKKKALLASKKMKVR